jgi:hypothetical protein
MVVEIVMLYFFFLLANVTFQDISKVIFLFYCTFGFQVFG